MAATMERTRQKERAAAPAAPVPLLPRSDAACSSTALAGSSLGSLDAELQRSTVSYLEPHAFFVSWQGVLTLAYSGFTDALVDLKARVAAAHPCLPPENPGSKWPKTSIGCLRDGARLTPEQLATLCRICSEESATFRQVRGEEPQLAPSVLHGAAAAAAAAGGGGGLRVAVGSACVALFECRSLERLLSCQHVRFQGGLDAAPPAHEEQQRVAGIVAECGTDDYWFKASRDGNREDHYRGSHLGATLMHPLLMAGAGGEAGTAGAAGAALGPSAPAGAASAAAPGPAMAAAAAGGAADRLALVDAIERFRRRVDAALPGMYAWFADTSLHITIRALIN